jgi:hypothetical protein
MAPRKTMTPLPTTSEKATEMVDTMRAYLGLLKSLGAAQASRNLAAERVARAQIRAFEQSRAGRRWLRV